MSWRNGTVLGDALAKAKRAERRFNFWIGFTALLGLGVVVFLLQLAVFVVNYRVAQWLGWL